MSSPKNIEVPVTPSKNLDELRRRINRSTALKRELSRRWRRSLWRILPAPILAYAIVGSYYEWALQMQEPWFRALGPVVVVLVFNITTPYVQAHWEHHTTKKIIAERDVRKKLKSEAESTNPRESS